MGVIVAVRKRRSCPGRTVNFLVNSGLTAAAIALNTGENPLKIWRAHFLWLAPIFRRFF